MAGLIFDKAQIEQTIDAVVARTMRMDMTWDWPCGVAYYGICEAYEVTGTYPGEAYPGERYPGGTAAWAAYTIDPALVTGAQQS